MNYWNTKKGSKVFQLLSRRSNCYLISGYHMNVMIDTGKKSSYRKLKARINQLIHSNNIHYLILTHTHFDHCQSAYQLNSDTGCKIIVSKNALENAQKGYSKLPDGTNFLTRSISKTGQLVGNKIFGFPPFKPDILIRGDNSLDIAHLDIKILETEGHSKDSMSIILDNEIALVGDTLFGIFKNSVFPPYADDKINLIQSWKKLLNTNCNIFLPGHGRSISRSLLEKEYAKYSRIYSL